jgi:hypothetical protein
LGELETCAEEVVPAAELLLESEEPQAASTPAAANTAAQLNERSLVVRSTVTGAA